MSKVELCLWRSHLVVDVCGEVWGIGGDGGEEVEGGLETADMSLL